MSTCGTFAVIGSAGGSIDMFNLQSGVHRLQFPPRPSTQKSRLALPGTAVRPQRAGESDKKHTKAVTGIAVDSLNRYVVSCGLDGKVKVCFLAVTSEGCVLIQT
jgi:U3 small nucleolar RNA-associated protein 21